VPVLSFFMALTVLASVGLPGLNGFVGEFLILLGSFASDTVGRPVLIAVATSGVIFAAYYLLWLLYRMFFGPLDKDENRSMPDLNLREIALLVPLTVFMIWIGLAPKVFLDTSEVSTAAILQTVEMKRDAVALNPESEGFVIRHDLLAETTKAD